MTNAHIPADLPEALALRARHHPLVYAGGTDLMPGGRRWMGLRPRLASEVMFIGHLPELKGVEIQADRLAIGACATLAAVMKHPDAPDILKKVISSMAAPGVRNLGTLGGNICNASPAGDALPYLYAVDAEVELQSARGARSLNVAEFITGPGRTVLADDEILTRILITPGGFNRDGHHKVAARKANALSKVSFLGLAQVGNRRINDLRLALGAVGPTVVRSRELELELMAAVESGAWDASRLDACLDSYAGLINPIDDQCSTAAYRRHTALGLMRDFLENLA